MKSLKLFLSFIIFIIYSISSYSSENFSINNKIYNSILLAKTDTSTLDNYSINNTTDIIIGPDEYEKYKQKIIKNWWVTTSFLRSIPMDTQLSKKFDYTIGINIGLAFHKYFALELSGSNQSYYEFGLVRDNNGILYSNDMRIYKYDFKLYALSKYPFSMKNLYLVPYFGIAPLYTYIYVDEHIQKYNTYHGHGTGFATKAGLNIILSHIYIGASIEYVFSKNFFNFGSNDYSSILYGINLGLIY